jgi:hypothetical protein
MSLSVIVLSKSSALMFLVAIGHASRVRNSVTP